MKVERITDNAIIFDNGNILMYLLDSDEDGGCDVHNYADFNQLDDIGRNIEFDEDLDFEETQYGFRFGNKPNKMFYIPCYSDQNGYYGTGVTIVYNGSIVETVDCKKERRN